MLRKSDELRVNAVKAVSHAIRDSARYPDRSEESERMLDWYWFPQDGFFSFQDAAIVGTRRIRLALDTGKRQIAVGIDRVDQLDVFFLDEHEIAFAKALQFLVDLIAHPALSRLREAMVLLARLPGTKANPIEIAFRRSDHLTGPQSGNAQGINDVRLGQLPIFAVGRGLVPIDRAQRNKGTRCGVQVRFALHGARFAGLLGTISRLFAPGVSSCFLSSILEHPSESVNRRNIDGYLRRLMTFFHVFENCCYLFSFSPKNALLIVLIKSGINKAESTVSLTFEQLSSLR